MRHENQVIRVGLLVGVALAILLTAIVLVGEKGFFFVDSTKYFVRFNTVVGLAEGNPVQLNGVDVGKVDRIVLPEDPGLADLEVWISVERRYAPRIRLDSEARIKTLGLLGDKYIEITSGSPAAPEIAAGEEIPAAQPTDVDALIASGENVVDNIVTTASSLSKILARMEAGEGVLGELVTPREDGKRVTDSILETLETVEGVTGKIEQGEGLVGRLLVDPTLADQVTGAVDRLDGILRSVEEGEGPLPRLLHDAEAGERVERMLASLEGTLGALESLSADLQTGDGLLPRLLRDADLGESASEDLKELLDRLNRASLQLTEGDGTVARLLNDPQVYEALNDILVGVDESKFLRWLVRNRQKAGIKKRYDEAQAELEAEGAAEGAGSD